MSREKPKYKEPKSTKFSFVMAIVLFLVGVIAGSDVVSGVAVVVLVVLSATSEILEKLHEIQHQRMGGE